MMKLFNLPVARRSSKMCFRVAVGFALSCIFLLANVVSITTAATQSEDGRELVPGTPIEREISAGDKQVYRITLEAGSYLRIQITQQNTNLQSKLMGPDSSDVKDVAYLPGEHGSSTLSLVADIHGKYRLEVHPAEGAKPGRYAIKIEELRLATEQDRVRVAAERAEGEGRALVFRVRAAEQRRQGIAKYEEALALWRKLDDKQGMLRTLFYLGTNHEEMGEPQASLECNKQAIEIARMVGDRYREGNLLLGTGVVHRDLGDTQKALDSFNQARQLYKNLSKKYGEALALNNIAMALVQIGDWESALSYLEEALPTLSSVGDRFSEINVLNVIGKVHRFLGDKQKAIEFHNLALNIGRAANRLSGEALSLGHLGDDYVELGENQKALDCYEHSLRLFRTLGHRLYEADALQRIGNVAHLSKDYKKALNSLNEALGLYRSTLDRRAEAKALHSLAELNYSLGNFDEARRQIEQSLEIQESLRANVISPQFRDTIFTSAQSSFSLYIDLLLQLHKTNPTAGYEAAALQASERARARGLLELLAESQADIREGVPKNLLELQRSLQQQINAKAAARTRLLSDQRTQAQAVSFDKEIADLTERFRQVEVEIRRSSPRYAGLIQPRPLTATQIQQQLDDNTLLLEFELGEKHGWLWAVTPAAISSYQLPSSGQIESSARKVYELLAARQTKKGETEAQYRDRFHKAEAEFQTEAATLSRMLLGQIATKLKQEWKGKRLAIVAPGMLEYLPFAALPSPAAQASLMTREYSPLVVDHEIINLPSASALASIRGDSAGRKRAQKTVAVIADPVFDLGDSRLPAGVKRTSNDNPYVVVRSESVAQEPSHQAAPTEISQLMRSVRSFKLTNEQGRFSRLPFSREEAESIASFTPNNSLLKVTDFRANRSTAVSGELSNYRVIHFATHGLLNGEHPELSGLVLSLVDEKGKPQDGFLRMHEIYNLNLPADLVVLSACQTALGKQIKGEGLVGLTRGFMYAGAQRVVASLWQVDDLATAHLMKSFYRGMLIEGLRPAAALRAAQIETQKQKRWSSPFFWAAFTIQGEWN